MQYFQSAFDRSLAVMLGPINPESRIYIFYLLSGLVLAYFAYVQVEKAHRAEDIAEGRQVEQRKGFLAYVFDPKIWLHPSSLQDFRFFLINSVVYYGLISQFLIGSDLLSSGFYQILTGNFGVPEGAYLSSAAGIAIYTLLSVLALDFGVFLMHYLHHRIPVLWHFHKVHHSAEELNPLTLFRMHPVDLALTSISIMVFQSMAYAGLFYLTNSPPTAVTVLGLNLVTFLFYVFGYNLRHSHIWLNYPVWLSNILVSPAQHQIHHSSDPKHFDMNMGLIFSFWDRMFGTLYIPVERENLRYGLSRKEPNPFKSVGELYYMPFVWAGETIRTYLATPRQRTIAYTSALTVLVAAVFGLNHVGANNKGPGLPSLELEKLTWTEIHAAIEKGYTSVIIPTGGTEQNGPFVALGKHNVIVAHTSNAIAARVGGTLIAPVMAYVPEGEIEPASGWMKFSGTISLPDPVFEQVLEMTALSLKAHGFTHIFILGESGDSQKAQERVAERLNAKWQDEGVAVSSLNEYYYANGQFDWLLGRGYTKDEIGYHAGMRDTSEVLALRPIDVRLLAGNRPATGEPGFSGNAEKASADIGNKMLSLKIEAGIAQMRKLLASGKGPAPQS
jgi:sterol desaturase/sphingolipid hydroxylase (fatty acid hydroxylase superfamily)/creatinine amidohydrolase/Fe(II)-dependent formamide hydrolase-like protein